MPLRSTPSRSYLLALTLAAALLASGCATEPPVPTPTAATTAPPIFASEDEALAAAEEAYGEYLRVVDQILSEGGRAPDRLKKIATPDLYAFEAEGFKQVRADKSHTTGTTTFDSMRIQRFVATRIDRGEQIAAYVCDDYSDVDVVNSDGVSVVRESRLDRVPIEVAFAFSDGELKVARIDLWEGENFCIN